MRLVKFEDKPKFCGKRRWSIHCKWSRKIDISQNYFCNEAAVRRFCTVEAMGVIKLRELGAKDGDVVRIKELEFDFLD